MELLDLVDEKNNLTGKSIDREIIHKEGLWHREVACIILNSEGKMLLEKRSPLKKQSPNKWALCAGHIEAGDKPENAIVREMQEEIGVNVSIDDLKFLKIARRDVKFNEEQYNRAFQYTYLWITDKKESDFIVQEEELTEVKYFDINEIRKAIDNKDNNFAFAKEEYINEILNLVENINNL